MDHHGGSGKNKFFVTACLPQVVNPYISDSNMHRAEKTWMNLLGFFLLVVGGGMTLYYGMDTRDLAYLVKDHGKGWGYGIHVGGEIVAISAQGDGEIRPLVRFVDNAGHSHEVPARFLVPVNYGYTIGDRLQVAYDPHQPNERYYVYRRGQQPGKLVFSDYAGVTLSSVLMFAGIGLIFMYRRINSY